MQDWIGDQAESLAAAWERSIELHYPDQLRIWTEPELHVQTIRDEWNAVEAVEMLDWQSILRETADKGNVSSVRVLDLGAGTGWMSALLSSQAIVESIDALDASRSNLREMLPHVVERMGGELSKIRPVRGLFSPLLVEPGTYELVVSASSIHHAESLVGVLKECRRVLKDSGTLVILNETPLTRFEYSRRILRSSVGILLSVARRRFVEVAPKISRTGILYDPFLGDVIYADYHWEAALRSASFEFDRVSTDLPPYKSSQNSRERLTHFICRPMADGES